MAKRITEKELIRAIKKVPAEVEREGKIFLTRGLAEYKKIAVQTRPWRVGQRAGGIPVATPKTSGYWGGNLREKHKTRISGLTGKFGVGDSNVPYAKFVHEGTQKMEARPWLDHARNTASRAVERHYNTFMDKIIKHIAS